MKSLLIINGEEKTVDIELLDISYGKFVRYDSVVIINTKEISEETFVDTKPSPKGIVDLVANELPLSNFLKDEELALRRKEKGIEIVEDKISVWDVSKLLKVVTKHFSLSDLDNTSKAVEELLEAEKDFQKFVVVCSPKIKFGKIQDVDSFWLEEEIHLVREDESLLDKSKLEN